MYLELIVDFFFFKKNHVHLLLKCSAVVGRCSGDENTCKAIL